MAKRKEGFQKIRINGNQAIPEPSLDHLLRLTDDMGLFQHAKLTTPLSSEGYTTDDNARGLIVAAKHYSLYRKREALNLIEKYLDFLLHACNKDGTVRNFMNSDGTWLKPEPVSDALGRAIWAFGELLAKPPSDIYVPLAKKRIEIALPLIEKEYLRGMAYSILGLSGYLKRFPNSRNVKSCMASAADLLLSQFSKNSYPNWPWFENILTYDNAMLPCSLFTAGITLREKRYIDVAKKTCDFLLANIYTDRHFSFIGCNGWYPRGGKKAQFDQQPIEAASTILMLNAAYQATRDKKFLALRRKAFNWFLGENDLGIPLYDSKSKGCSDGLGTEGINLNEGAESTLSFLLGLLAIRENNI